MLVISRRCDEAIVLPDLGVTVQILRVDSNRTKLGIIAPPDVRIVREEAAHLPDPPLAQATLETRGCEEPEPVAAH